MNAHASLSAHPAFCNLPASTQQEIAGIIEGAAAAGQAINWQQIIALIIQVLQTIAPLIPTSRTS